MAEWVLAIYIGAAHTQSAPLSLLQPALDTDLTFAEVFYRGHSFRPPIYYGYRLSFFPRTSAALGIEAEFIHLKVYARTERQTRAVGALRNHSVDRVMPISNVVEHFSISHGLNLLLVNAVIRRTIGLSTGSVPRVQFLGRAGAGPTLAHPESTVDGVSHEDPEVAAVALQAAGGLEVRLSDHFTALVEYKFTRTFQHVTVDRGTARAALASHHAVFGLAWHPR